MYNVKCTLWNAEYELRQIQLAILVLLYYIKQNKQQNVMTESMEESAQIPNINLESSKPSDSYEINVNTLLVVGAVVVLLVGGILFWRFKSSGTVTEISPTPTPSAAIVATNTPTSTPTPTTSKVTPTKETSPTLSPKQKVKINVLNGTGATGDAAFLKSKLVAAGFSSIDTGNASSTSAEAKTEVIYYESFPSTLKIDLTTLLNDLYASVSAQTSTESAKHDAVIVTGKKK